jgi:hypothetical protein
MEILDWVLLIGLVITLFYLFVIHTRLMEFRQDQQHIKEILQEEFEAQSKSRWMILKKSIEDRAGMTFEEYEALGNDEEYMEYERQETAKRLEENE